jgi:hypothetical protein
MATGEYKYAVNQHVKSFHDRPSNEFDVFCKAHNVDTTELFHAYFFYVSAERLFSKIPYHTQDKSQTSL